VVAAEDHGRGRVQGEGGAYVERGFGGCGETRRQLFGPSASADPNERTKAPRFLKCHSCTTHERVPLDINERLNILDKAAFNNKMNSMR
jgi:hypothetical protein